MQKRIILLTLFALLLTACASSAAGGGALAVENYLNALIAKDADAVINGSCLEWESGAQADIDSFLTVEASLTEDFACADSGPNQVECSGAILFTYGDEVQELLLEGTVYSVVEEAGEWRMCGYQ
ncbi:MAG: hypothetical protein HND51_24055 [Chloroflexi bacterium]|nr:hypothetical protein [Chloroflexota bacterium]NOH14723.1 hypothetical protein [Chloroflexota bacterium]